MNKTHCKNVSKNENKGRNSVGSKMNIAQNNKLKIIKLFNFNLKNSFACLMVSNMNINDK
jgi:hypothetical protein